MCYMQESYNYLFTPVMQLYKYKCTCIETKLIRSIIVFTLNATTKSKIS